MQFANFLGASRYLAPAQPFIRPEDEAAFRTDYIRGGYGFAVAVTLLGTLMSGGFILAANLAPLDGANSFELQLLRAIIGICCGLSLFSLLIDPERSLRNFKLTIFLPAFVALFGLGILLFLPRPEATSEIAFGRATLSLIMAIWMISAFCRLPLRQVMVMTLTASMLNLAGLYWHNIAHLPYFVLDLVITNVIVWCLTVQIEKRERVIWHQASRQLRATRRAKRQAEQANVVNNAQTRLIRSVGHDIRQPLSSSGIYLGVVSQAAGDSANETLLQNIDRVRTCLRSVEGTLDRLLEVPRETADNGLATGRCDLALIFRDLRDVFDPQADRLGVELRFTRACKLPMMARTNERAMREVLSNIVANALKYTSIVSHRRPAVIVGAVQFGNTIRVDIVDNGVGIANELHTRVFEEYYRSPTVVDRVRGTGLGLAIVESTVQRLPDHHLRLNSREGQGTRLKVYLPCA